MIGFSGTAATAQEKAKADKPSGRTVSVFVENDRVKVYEGRFAPREKAPKCQSVQIEWNLL